MFHTLSASAVVTELTSDERLGLTSDEARARLTTYGPNLLPEAEKKHWLAVLFGYFKDFLMVILMIAALISFLVGDVKDAVVILLIVVANALMGFFQESKADNAIAALKKLSVAKAKVIRNGQTLLLDAKDVVPGDVLILETGDKIPADARLLESIQLKIAESALTGESKPVQKDQAFISQANVSIGDRLNMVYKDTVVLYGRGKAVVTATGIATEMGKISQLLQHEDQKTTPLNSELNTLGKKLTIFAAAVAILIFFIILFLDPSQVKNAFLTSVSMAIAVVPEGIPAVVTTVLAISVARLARKRAIVRKLSAVETLGAASCILTDKTGTLTKNEMTVSDLFVPGRDLQWQQEAWVENGQKVNPHTDPALRQLIYCAILCNDASLSDTQVLGDPTEACLITMARQAGFDINKIRSEHQRLFELPFSSETKQMTVVVRDAQQQILVFTKGASEVVSGYLTQSLPTYAAAAEQMAARGIRCLAYSYKTITGDLAPSRETLGSLLSGHEYLGVIGCKDPLRPEAKEAVTLAASAGIRTIMITGDHKHIAENIALELGIITQTSQVVDGLELARITDAEWPDILRRANVFSRVSPEQKLQIVKASMQNGETVIVTGDGVNDAPAIKTADIGVAMGISGTDVAKEAADLVLQDDNYSTIVGAIKQGRAIFTNFSKFLSYQIACNLSGVLIVFPLTILTGTSPLFPVHILLLNLISETGPCIALGLEKPEKNIMQRKPRKRTEQLLTRRRWIKIILEAIILAAVSIVAFFIASEVNATVAMSAVLTTAFLSRLWHALSARSESLSIFSPLLQTNRGLYYTVFGTFLFLYWSLYTNLGNALTKTIPLDRSLFLICLGLSLVPVVMVEGYKVVARGRVK